jgi:hypothetical protein
MFEIMKILCDIFFSKDRWKGWATPFKVQVQDMQKENKMSQ